MSEGVATVHLMSSSTLVCPNGCGDLSVFISRRGRRQRPYTGCRSCGYADYRGGSPALDEACATVEPVNPPVEYERIDHVIGDDPYAGTVN